MNDTPRGIWTYEGEPLHDGGQAMTPTEPTSKMVTEGARALDLWSDESLREEIDARRMAELVWTAMLKAASDEERS
jgi:hypothetical protein